MAAAAALKVIAEAVGGGAIGGGAVKGAAKAGAKDIGGKSGGLGEMLNKLIDTIKPLLDLSTAIVGLLVYGFMMLLKGLWEGSIAYFENSLQWFSDLWDGIINLPENIWNAIQEGYTWVTDKLGEVWEAITQVAGQIWEFIKQVPGMIWTFLLNLPSMIWEFIQSGFNWIVEGVKWLGTKIKEFFTWLWEKVKPIFEPLLEKIKGVWDFMKTLAEDIWTKLKEGFEWVRDKVQGVWDSIKNLAQDIADKIEGVLGSAGGAAKRVISAVNPFDDFISRPGEPMRRFSPDDTIIGMKSSGGMGGGTTINFYGLTMDEAIEKVKNEIGGESFRYGRF